MNLWELGPEQMRLVAWVLGPVVGLILGSFYTALASRILYYYYGPGRKTKGWVVPHLLSRRWLLILTKPSFCFACQQRITGLSLWPVLGYLLSFGRCRRCKAPFSWLNLAGECYLGLLLPLLLLNGASWPLALLYCVFAGHLYISLATDTLYYQLDHENAFVLALLALATVGMETGFRLDYLLSHLWAALGSFLIFALLHLFYKKGIGFADIPFVSILAFSLGLPWVLLCIQIAGLLAILYIYLVLKDARAPAPLGSGLAVGWLVALPLSYVWSYRGLFFS